MSGLFGRIWVVFSLFYLYACDSGNGQIAVNPDRVISDAELINKRVKNTDSKKKSFVFGFDLRSTPQEDARQYLPFLKYLEKKTGYEFKLRFTPVDGQIVEDLGTGEVHFAAIGAISFIKANEKYGVVPLVRGLNNVGKAEYRSMIVVRNNNPVKNIKSLVGRKIAFGSRTSTQGHIIPRIIFEQHRISLKDFKSYIFTGSHQKCADAVISGRADACGMQDKLAERLAGQGLLRILFASEFFPSSGIAANQDVPQDVLKNVTAAMLDFKPMGRDADGLYHWNRTEMPGGFQEASVEDYKVLKRWLVRLEGK